MNVRASDRCDRIDRIDRWDSFASAGTTQLVTKANLVVRCDDAEANNGTRVGRADFGRLPNIEKLARTPTGGIRVPARIARTGVLLYPRADGSVFREYRPDEEAFAAPSLASIEDAVVTVGHPPDALVSPQTARQHSVGHVRGAGSRDGSFVAAELVVLDAFAIDGIAAGTLVELSSGYTCRLEMTPGVAPDGSPYDAVQRDVTYNHVALLPSGTGRAGSDVSLRLDGIAIRLESPTPPPQPRTDAMEEIINGKKYTIGSAEWWAAHTRRLDELEAAASEGEGEKKSLKEKLDELTAKRDALQAQLDAATAEIEQMKKDMSGEGEGEEKMDALVNERLEVIEVVRQVLGADAKVAGKSNDALRREVITKLDGAASLIGADGKPKSADYVRAYYESASRRAGTGSPGSSPRKDSNAARPVAPGRVASPMALRSATPWDLRNR